MSTMKKQDRSYRRLEDQIIWYDSKSVLNQRCYKYIKLLEVICAIFISFLKNHSHARILGILIIVLESMQQIWQYQYNWITYRSTCEALKHQKFLYLEKSGPYNIPDPEARILLVETVESLISTEHSKWISKKYDEGGVRGSVR
jgi:hypothetical protein